MAIDTRDWYKDWLKKKGEYVERARFRMGDAEFARYKRAKAWRSAFRLAMLFAFLAMIAAGITQFGTVGRWLHHLFAWKSLIPLSTIA